MRKLSWLVLSVFIVAVDQTAKYFALKCLTLHKAVTIWPNYFNLRLAYNYGAAFSFLGHAGGWQRWLFIGLSIGISLMLLLWLKFLPRREQLQACAIALIIGGAIGNLIDRIRFGHVIDFFDFYYKNWHWPTFNVADAAIVLGVILLLWKTWIKR